MMYVRRGRYDGDDASSRAAAAASRVAMTTSRSRRMQLHELLLMLPYVVMIHRDELARHAVHSAASTG
jgi:hypothetical protein